MHCNDRYHKTRLDEPTLIYVMWLYMHVSVECSAGTYYDATSKTCKYCPVGEYQTSPGQVQCTACDQGMTTETYGSVAVDECYGENLCV